MNLLIYAFLFSIAVNLLMFIPAFIYKTDKLTDISYAVTFAAVASFSLINSDKSTPHFLLWLMVMAWAARLGLFLFIRINKMKKDKRFDGMREDFWKFGRFWLLQGVSVFVVLINSILLWQEKEIQLNIFMWVGLVVFILGLTTEAIADKQKYVFNSYPENKGKWIETGLWARSRHPNYLGEMTVWVGVYIFTVGSLDIATSIISLISPLYIISLIMFVSGVPLLEKSADNKWGNDKKYQEYKSRVPRLLPKLSIR